MINDIHGHREDYGRIMLRRYGVQRLKVAQLERKRIENYAPLWYPFSGN